MSETEPRVIVELEQHDGSALLSAVIRPTVQRLERHLPDDIDPDDLAEIRRAVIDVAMAGARFAYGDLIGALEAQGFHFPTLPTLDDYKPTS